MCVCVSVSNRLGKEKYIICESYMLFSTCIPCPYIVNCIFYIRYYDVHVSEMKGNSNGRMKERERWPTSQQMNSTIGKNSITADGNHGDNEQRNALCSITDLPLLSARNLNNLLQFV